MIDEKALKQAQAVFKALCERMEEHDWKYEKVENDFTIVCGAQGEDLPMELHVKVDAERQIVTILSQMPFAVPEDRRTALAVAVSQANNGMIDGSFDFDYLSGRILYRITASYRESLIGKKLFSYLLTCACYIIDEYNDKFLKVVKSDMSVEEILDYVK